MKNVIYHIVIFFVAITFVILSNSCAPNHCSISYMTEIDISNNKTTSVIEDKIIHLRCFSYSSAFQIIAIDLKSKYVKYLNVNIMYDNGDTLNFNNKQIWAKENYCLQYDNDTNLKSKYIIVSINGTIPYNNENINYTNEIKLYPKKHCYFD